MDRDGWFDRDFIKSNVGEIGCLMIFAWRNVNKSDEVEK